MLRSMGKSRNVPRFFIQEGNGWESGGIISKTGSICEEANSMKIRYIGKFPPPYGGVTIKNKLLYQELSSHIPIIRLKERKGIPSFLHQIANFLTAFFKNQRLVIGISSRGGK